MVQEKVKPSEIFADVEESLNFIDKAKLKKYKKVANKLLAKAEVTGQKALKQRLEFRLRSLERELRLLKEHNIKTYVEKDIIVKYIEQTEHREVKITDIASYMREIPDEAIEIVGDTREIFDDYVILFTDYTGEMDARAEEIVVEKDPILFGVFYDAQTNEYIERYYYLYDWEDEYCDLTLDKMIMEYKDISDEEVVKNIDGNISNATKGLKEEDKL